MTSPLDARMRDVLLQLAMTSNARTATYDSSGGGLEDYALVDDRGRGKLGLGDAPHLTYARWWDRAVDDQERAAVLEAAKDELEHIRKSRARPTVAESREDRDRRIVTDGEGWPAREVANSMRCGIKDVWHARRAAGRDAEFGRPVRNGRELSRDELRAEVLRLTNLGMSTHAIADALNIARSSVRYALARAKQPPGSR